MLDGGYYAIKGFSFQFDRTILELLDSVDDQNFVFIENIQDINTDNFVMQVKYKESQSYADLKIREPVLQLLEEYQKDNNQKFVLYCHFKDKETGVEIIDLERINSILKQSTGKSKEALTLNKRLEAFDQNQISSFINNFTLFFAPDYDSQFEKLLKHLMALSYVKSEELAVLYYSNIVEYLKRIVLSNTDPSLRKTCKSEVLEYLKKGKRLIYSAAFEEYQGSIAYYKMVKKQFIKPLKNQKNLIVLGDIEVDSEITIGHLITAVCENWYKKATYDIEPLTFVIPDLLSRETKEQVLCSGITFNDGYESIAFNINLFCDSALKIRKTVGGKASDSLFKISFKVRLISNSTFKQWLSKLTPRMVYYFDSNNIPEFESAFFQKIERLSTRKACELLCM